MAGGHCPGLLPVSEFSTFCPNLHGLPLDPEAEPSCLGVGVRPYTSSPAPAQPSTGLSRMRTCLWNMLGCCCFFWEAVSAANACKCGVLLSKGTSSLLPSCSVTTLRGGSSLRSWVPLRTSLIICSRKWPHLVTSLDITLGFWANLLLTLGLQRQWFHAGFVSNTGWASCTILLSHYPPCLLARQGSILIITTFRFTDWSNLLYLWYLCAEKAIYLAPIT